MINISSTDIILMNRILVAVVLGVCIGIQRERRKLVDKSYGSAGLRTHALVSLGTALVSAVLIILAPSNGALNLAAIMTGIGFIGAGTIISNEGKIKGLANAASIWVAAAIGIAVGLGFYAVSITATILAVIILELRRFEAID